MENSFKNVIGQSKSIIVLIPTKPYFDQVASALSLYLAFRDEKDITVYSPSPMTVEYNRLVGVNKIAYELGNKNLVIRFVDYKATDIERVSYDIENSQFRLTVIPKQKIAPPSKDQIELAYAGVSSDTVIIIGGANETHFPALSSKDLTGANIVHIGTRDISLSTSKNYVSFSRPASSISEIVASLIKEEKGNFDSDIATNLLMGIEEASNNFSDPSVTAETFSIFAELMKAGGKRMGAQGAVQRRDFPMGSVPGDLPRPSIQRELQNNPQTPRQAFMHRPVSNNPKSQANTEQPAKASENSQDASEKAPSDWLKPKIFKGTTVS